VAVVAVRIVELTKQLHHLAVWVAGVTALAALALLPLLRVLLTQAEVEVEAQLTQLAPQAVQALSFFATPAQFNISLVAQYY
jgi:hypothetical protein